MVNDEVRYATVCAAEASELPALAATARCTDDATSRWVSVTAKRKWGGRRWRRDNPGDMLTATQNVASKKGTTNVLCAKDGRGGHTWMDS